MTRQLISFDEFPPQIKALGLPSIVKRCENRTFPPFVRLDVRRWDRYSVERWLAKRMEDFEQKLREYNATLVEEFDGEPMCHGR